MRTRARRSRSLSLSFSTKLWYARNPGSAPIDPCWSQLEIGSLPLCMGKNGPICSWDKVGVVPMPTRFTHGVPEGPEIEKNHSRPNAWKTIPHARKNHSRLKSSFSVSNFHPRLKYSISGLVFLQSERGSEWKNILEWKCHSVLKAWFLQYCLSRLNFFNPGPYGVVRKVLGHHWPSTGVLENPGKESEKGFPGGPRPWGQKAQKRVEKWPFFKFFSGFWLVFDSFSNFFSPGAERPRNPFSDSFRGFSRERPFWLL